VAVEVYAENISSGSQILTNKAFITFVALDGEGKPTPVPPLLLKTPDELNMAADAVARREERLKRRES